MTSLREKLIQNRTEMGTGSGKKYWDSVLKVVERHYGQTADKGRTEPKIVGNEIVRMDWVLDCRTPEDGFKDDLEDVLDEHFPKGACKHRGAALVLFAYANILFAKHLKRALKNLR